MGQADTLKALKEEVWMDSKEIQVKSKQQGPSVNISLRKLLKQGEVLRKMVRMPRGGHFKYLWMKK